MDFHLPGLSIFTLQFDGWPVCFDRCPPKGKKKADFLFRLAQWEGAPFVSCLTILRITHLLSGQPDPEL